MTQAPHRPNRYRVLSLLTRRQDKNEERMFEAERQLIGALSRRMQSGTGAAAAAANAGVDSRSSIGGDSGGGAAAASSLPSGAGATAARTGGAGGGGDDEDRLVVGRVGDLESSGTSLGAVKEPQPEKSRKKRVSFAEEYVSTVPPPTPST